MRVLRRAAVLMILLGLCLGTPGTFAKPRSEAPRPASTAGWSAVQLFDALWSRLAGWVKAGLGSDPLGSPRAGATSGSQPQDTKEGPRIDPLGSPSPSNGAQTQSIDEGCTIEPLGQCLPGH